MKRTATIFIALLLGVTSCRMEETFYNYIDATDYIKDATSARNVLYGVYRNMSTNDLYGYHLSIIFDMPTDISKVDEASVVNGRDVCWNAHTADNSRVLGTWSAAYNVIYNANDFLEKVTAAREDMPEDDKEIVDLYIAEARSIRALMYFELVRLFGGVTLITSTAQSFQHPSTFVRNDPEEIYSFIEGELEECAGILPWAQDDQVRSDNSFMFSKAGVLGLLARVYATHAGYPQRKTGKWPDCENCCRQIIEAGYNSLLTDYETLWKNCCNGVWDPTEALIQICFYSKSISSLSSQNNSGYIGKWNGVHVKTNSSKLVRVDARQRAVSVFMARWKDLEMDKRWALSAADYSYDGEDLVPMCTSKAGEYIPFSQAMYGSSTQRDNFKKGLYIAKYDLTKYQDKANMISDGNYSNANWYLLRYSDVLLLFAEALNEINGGPTDEAYEAVNTVRRRAFGLPVDEPSEAADLEPGMDHDRFLTALQDERAYELCFEGNRKQDLIRWGIYYRKIQNTIYELEDFREGFGIKSTLYDKTVEGKHELQPIPQREKDLMTQYTQNPNW
ncbi:MAG: RagB/SusD family nutrient uptake outer membrane protein [Bacteroidales bacterium]|nr:RagB/SusD family nutrient uptake outer membrane protein [Bacteroidales bacterium]